ncbi:MAG: DUF3987 domain-containing protein [Aequorivita antarctica]
MEKEYFSREIYENLPDLLQNLVKGFDDREKDIVLLSTMGVLSNCIPNVIGFYGRKKHYPQLYTMIIAPPASGKGSMNYASILIEDIHQKKLEESREKIKFWEKQKKGEKPNIDARIIPGNVSSAKFYSHIKNNEHGLLIFESEADSMSNMLKQDWGNFSDILRKAFHHEKISISREIDDKFIEVTSPKLAMVISGTEGQVKPLILSKENGLFSRFLYYYFNDEVEWKDVTPDEENLDYSIIFKESSSKILRLYEELEKLQKPIEFKLTTAQWEKLNYTLKTATSIFTNTGLTDLIPTAFRNGVNLFRIAMILSVIRKIDSIKDDEILTCNDQDFEIAHSIIKYLLDHVLLVAELFEKDKYGLSVFELNILSNLPKKFKRSEAIDIGEELDIKSRTMDNYLKKWKKKGALKAPKTGFYEQQISTV